MGATVPLNILEVTIYAMVLAGGNPLVCTRQDGTEEMILCSNGQVATLDGDRITFKDGTAVVKFPDGTLAFSNGIRSHWGSAGWVQFSNKISIRRNTDGTFKTSTGLVCRELSTDKANCQKA